MKTLVLSVGILGCRWGSAPILLIPSTWFGYCWYGVVGLDLTCEGTALMFRVVLDFRGITREGFYLLSQSVSQLPSGVANLNVVGLFVILGWTTSYYTEAQVFWIRELELVQLQFTLVWPVHKLCPFCWNFGYIPMAGKVVTRGLQQTHTI